MSHESYSKGHCVADASLTASEGIVSYSLWADRLLCVYHGVFVLGEGIRFWYFGLFSKDLTTSYGGECALRYI